MGYARSLADVEQIEVFKGPGSALFGSAGGGGTINLTMKKPKRDSVTIGDFPWVVSTHLGVLSIQLDLLMSVGRTGLSAISGNRMDLENYHLQPMNGLVLYFGCQQSFNLFC